MSKANTLLLGAWKLLDDVEYIIYFILVPTAWRQVAQSLASERASSGYSKYPSVPVSSLDPIICASFSQIIQTMRYGWQHPGVPWIFATEAADISYLPEFVKDWLREEFSWCLGESVVDSRLSKLNNNDWHWHKPITNHFWSEPGSNYSIDFRFKILPDLIAKEFLKNPTVSFFGEQERQLNFYPVVRLNKGAELMSFPPQRVSLIDFVTRDKVRQKEVVGEAYISFVINFKLQTVPWHSEPMIYHELSIRRWMHTPIEKLPYRGATAYIGDNHRWLDGSEQPFSFMRLNMKLPGRPAQWHKAINELLKNNDTRLPEPEVLALEPMYNWSENPIDIQQAAIAYDTRHRVNKLCLPGVSPLDLASLDKAIEIKIMQENLPLQRVGKAVKISETQESFWEPGTPRKRGSKEPKNPDDLSTPMLRPKIMAPAAFRNPENSPQSILILWETREWRDALINEICQQLSLSFKQTIQKYETIAGAEDEETVYEGDYGHLIIRTQFILDLAEKLDIDVKEKNRQKKREKLIIERIQKIASSLPKPNGSSGALIEIKPKKLFFPPESDPKLALRIGVMQAGYVNQFMYGLTKSQKDNENRSRRAVSDLLRQFGILPAHLIDPQKDGIDANIWLTCFYVLRRTRKTTASKATTVVLMARVNPVAGFIEITTPSLFPTWVSYSEAMGYLITEKWEPDSDSDAMTIERSEEEELDNIKKERKLLDIFVTNCLRDCLNTQIEPEKDSRVLFMAEAQNARKMLTWLQNSELPANDIPKVLELSESEKNRLWLVRLRVANNGEVPVGIIEGSPGSRSSTGGVFHWEDVSDKPKTNIYLSLRKPLTTEQGVLRIKQSRFDDGNKQAGNPKLLEIAIVHHPGIEGDKLATFIHNLRNRYPYFADDISLPFPFPFAKLAKEYAVSAKDTIESNDCEESEDLEDIDCN